MATTAAIVGRICLALLFILSGLNKVMDPGSTAEYISSQTALPGSLAMPTGVFEIVAGLILASGFMTRLASAVLAGFTALTIPLFHYQITDPIQAQAALKNVAIVGGLLMVFAYGQVRGRIGTLSERDKRLEAEVRAARAEARAEGQAEGAVQRPTD